jgi:trigger factor
LSFLFYPLIYSSKKEDKKFNSALSFCCYQSFILGFFENIAQMPTSTHSFNEDKHTVMLTIDLPKSEYMKSVDDKLKEYRKQVQLKGFRKGKAPMNLLRSRYGGAVLFEELNQLIDKEVQNFIKEENLKILGNPLPRTPLKTSIQRPTDVKMDVEIGYVPNFEVAGIDNEKLMPFYEVEIAEEQLKEEVEKLRKSRSFEFEEGVTEVAEGDMLTVALREMDGDSVKEDGFSKESTYITLDKASDDIKSKLIGANVGDKIQGSLYELDSALGEEKALQYFYDVNLDAEELPEINAETEIEVLEVKRVKLKELNEEFFKEVYPDAELADEAAFLERFKEDVKAQYNPKVNNIYYRAIYEELMEQNKDMSLPKEFLRDWLAESQEEDQKQEVSDEALDNFLERLRWSLILDKLSEARNIEVSQDDIEQRVRYAISQYYGFQIPPNHPMLDDQVKQMLSDRDTVRRYAEQILEDKVLTSLGDDFSKDIKNVSVEELDEVYDSIFNSRQEEESTEEEVVEETAETEE